MNDTETRVQALKQKIKDRARRLKAPKTPRTPPILDAHRFEMDLVTVGPDAYPDLYARCRFAFNEAVRLNAKGRPVSLIQILRKSEAELTHLHHIVVFDQTEDRVYDVFGDNADERCYRCQQVYELNEFGAELSVFGSESIDCHPGDNLDDCFNTLLSRWSVKIH